MPVSDSGSSASVISMPSTSSITTTPGSLRPSAPLGARAAHTPIANTATMADSSTAGTPIQLMNANSASAASDPAVPGAIGK